MPPIWDLETPKLDMSVAFILLLTVDWVTVGYDPPTTLRFPPTVELPTYTIQMSEFMFPSTVAPDSSNTIVPLDLTFTATMAVKSRPRTPSFLDLPVNRRTYTASPLATAALPATKARRASIRSIGTTNNRRMCMSS